jgi:protein SEY1
MDATLSPLFLGQLKNLHKACLAGFKRALLDGLRGEEYSFADVVGTARGQAEGAFETGAREAVVEEGTGEWNWEEERELLREEIGSVADQCRKDETKKMVNMIEVSGRRRNER